MPNPIQLARDMGTMSPCLPRLHSYIKEAGGWVGRFFLLIMNAEIRQKYILCTISNCKKIGGICFLCENCKERKKSLIKKGKVGR